MNKLRISKVCPSCGLNKPRVEYYKKLDTISYRCKPCTLEYCRTHNKKYFGKYAGYQNQWRKDKYANDPEYKERITQQKSRFYQDNKTKINESRRERWRDDPLCPQRLTYRRKDVKDRTPKWVSKKALLLFYSKCPKGMHIDHIIPLKGLIDNRPVCGLHVPWNLQYLTPLENRKKYNRISETDL